MQYIIALLYIAYKQWNKMIDSAKSLRDETGLTADEALRLTKISADVVSKYGTMGVSFEVMSKSVGALVNEFQSTSVLTEGMMKNVGLMVGALGVAPDSSAKTLRIFKNMGIE